MKLPEFRAGDTVTVHYKIIEGDKVRTQPFTGIVISKRGEGVSKTFMVRRIGADGIGVERIFPLFSPNIEKLVVEKTGKVRRAKLYYLREKVGRQATKVKERFGDIIVAPEVSEPVVAEDGATVIANEVKQSE
ncbi:50S ribosomal protein L19 [candidate division WWE3 bacterium CG08_land_8_20_14_0_20_41_10]|uniref:50S ribosomal protein L19 n=1 Tax=candidate division WWE3 bacterium CG08_land_8_20_14_0_20_41_10 TaxID=1975085 RepID=A0A2H0XCW5_UNCKA|nr:MAG: 50S ribosomal protein L19 [candidate division WWE3 bacterium CG08_land_8_20_14_0_20_41_10]